MINPVEYLKMVHTVVSVITVDGSGAFSIFANPGRIGLSISSGTSGNSSIVAANYPGNTPAGFFQPNGIAGDFCFNWLFHGTLPSLGFTASGWQAGDTLIVTELIINSEQTDQISRG